jgi:hypothetical protein
LIPILAPTSAYFLPLPSTLFNSPTGITTDGTNVYVSDQYSQLNQIVSIPIAAPQNYEILAGVISKPVAMVWDSARSLAWVADSEKNQLNSVDFATGVTNVLSTPGVSFSSLSDVAVSATGTLYASVSTWLPTLARLPCCSLFTEYCSRRVCCHASRICCCCCCCCCCGCC